MIYSEAQRARLEEIFWQDRYPRHYLQENLAQELGLEQYSIQVRFVQFSHILLSK